MYVYLCFIYDHFYRTISHFLTVFYALFKYCANRPEVIFEIYLGSHTKHLIFYILFKNF